MLRELSLDVKPGLTVILGPNGAGKTTLLKAIAGLIPRSGDVWLDDELAAGANTTESCAAASRSCPKAASCSRR